MADNVELNSGTGGATLAADDIGGIHHQRVKIQHGADGSATDVSTASPLPVDLRADNLAAALDVAVENAHSADFDTGAGTDTTLAFGIAVPASGGAAVVPGDATAGLKVDLGADNDVVVSGTVTANAGTGPFPVSDNDGSLTVDGTVTANLSATDNAVLDQIEVNTSYGEVVGGGTEATALRVTLASDSTGVLSVDDNGSSLTVDGTVAATQSGAWNIGDITGTVSLPTGASTAANQATIIGHVDGIEGLLTTIDADTGALAGAVKAEDAAHNTGDTGIPALAVQQTADAALAGTDGDYAPLQVDDNGFLKVNIKAGAGSGGTASTDDAAFTAGSGSGTPMMGFVTADAVDSGDVGVVGMDTNRNLKVSIEVDNVGIGGGTQYTDDTDTHGTGSSIGNLLMAAATPTDGSVDANDIGAVAMSLDRRLHTDAQIVGQDANLNVDVASALPAGDNNIGNVDLASSIPAGTNNIGDVDVLTMPGTAGEAAALPSVFVVVAGDDGTDTHPLQLDGSGHLQMDLAADSVGLALESGGNLATIAGAVSGTEMQVDVVGALPAGDNNIGNVDIASALPSGTNNIGDVDVATIAAGSNLIGDVGIGVRTSGGTTPYKNLDVDESEDEVKGSGGQIYWIHAINVGTAPRYLKFYNATAANVTVGTTTPVLTFPVPSQGDANGAGFNLAVPNGIAFSTAITIAATTGVADADTGAPGANEVIVNLGYA